MRWLVLSRCSCETHVTSYGDRKLHRRTPYLGKLFISVPQFSPHYKISRRCRGGRVELLKLKFQIFKCQISVSTAPCLIRIQDAFWCEGPSRCLTTVTCVFTASHKSTARKQTVGRKQTARFCICAKDRGTRLNNEAFYLFLRYKVLAVVAHLPCRHALVVGACQWSRRFLWHRVHAGRVVRARRAAVFAHVLQESLNSV